MHYSLMFKTPSFHFILQPCIQVSSIAILVCNLALLCIHAVLTVFYILSAVYKIILLIRKANSLSGNIETLEVIPIHKAQQKLRAEECFGAVGTRERCIFSRD